MIKQIQEDQEVQPYKNTTNNFELWIAKECESEKNSLPQKVIQHQTSIPEKAHELHYAD